MSKPQTCGITEMDTHSGIQRSDVYGAHIFALVESSVWFIINDQPEKQMSSQLDLHACAI